MPGVLLMGQKLSSGLASIFWGWCLEDKLQTLCKAQVCDGHRWIWKTLVIAYLTLNYQALFFPHTQKNMQLVTDKKNILPEHLKCSEISSCIAIIPTRYTHHFHLWTRAWHPRRAHLAQTPQVHLLLARQNCLAEKLPGRLSAFACCPGNLTQKCFKTTMRNFFLVLNKTKRKRG